MVSAADKPAEADFFVREHCTVAVIDVCSVLRSICACNL